MKRCVKKFISACMVLAMLCSIAPNFVFASDNESVYSSYLEAGRGFVSTYDHPSYAEIMSRGDRYETAKLYTLPQEEWGDYIAYKMFTLSEFVDLKGCNITRAKLDEFVRYANIITPWWPLFHHSEKILDAGGSVGVARFVYITDRTEELKSEEKRVRSLVEGSQSDTAKAIAVHDFLCREIQYDLNAKRDIFSPALDKTAQCEGYARMYAYYMNLLGIPCEYIEGNSTAGYHAWNRIYIDGQWYLVDVTWDDAGGVKQRADEVYHRYFLKSGEDFPDHSVSGADKQRCNDDRFKNAFWNDADSVYTVCGDYIIYPDVVNDVYVIRAHHLGTDPITQAGKQIAIWSTDWRDSSNKPVTCNCSTPVSYQGKVYYNTSTSVWRCDADGGNKEKIIDLFNPVAGQPSFNKSDRIFNLEMKDGTMFIGTAANIDDWREANNCKKYSYVIDSANAYVKTPQIISSSKESLLLTVGDKVEISNEAEYGTVRIDFQPSALISVTSADTSICDIQDGYVVGKSAGKTTLVLTTPETAEYKAGYKVIPVEVTESSVVDISKGYAMVNNKHWRWPLAYTGSEVCPPVEVGYFNPESQVLDPEHYDVRYENNINEGTATVTVTAKGEGYRGSLTTSFPIAKTDLSSCTVQLSGTSFEYTGAEIRPSVVVIDSYDYEIPADEYDISYKNNIKPGEATVTLTGRKNCKGTQSAVFTIEPKEGESILDTDALTAAVEKFNGINPSDYSNASYNNLKDIVDKNRPLLDTAESQYEIDSAVTEILEAIYDLKPYLNLTVSAENGSCDVTYDGSTSGNGTYSLLFGTEVTLSATANDGYEFVGWYDVTNNLYFSRSSTYTFKITSNTNLKAVFVKERSATLTFATYSNWVQSTVTKTIDEWSSLTSIDDLLPEVPYKYGYSNGRWVYDNDDVLSKLKMGESVTLIPEYDEDDTSLPTLREPENGVPALDLYYKLDANANVGSFVMAAGIPDDCRIESVGVAFYYKKASEFDPTNFELLLNNKMLVGRFNADKPEDIYIVNMNKFTSVYNWAARGYVTYYDAKGNLKTAYSNQINIINRQQV